VTFAMQSRSGRPQIKRNVKPSDRRAEAAVRLNDVKDRLQKFRTVTGAAVCSECRRPIDGDHAAKEIKKLEAEIRASEQRTEECAAAVQDAIGQWAVRDTALTALQQQMRTAERQREDATRSLQQAARSQQDAVRGFSAGVEQVTDPYRSQLADIHVPGFPTASDLAGIAQLSESVDSLDKRVRALRQSKTRL